jgi:hypothetical protein
MAKKIVLGKRPKSFARTVTFAMPGEEVGSIEVQYKYRTRTEFADFMDKLQGELRNQAEAETKRLRQSLEAGETIAEPSQATITARQNALNVRYLLDAVDGWNLDVPFDKEAVEQLVDELPAAVAAIVNDYRSAIVDGRLGN